MPALLINNDILIAFCSFIFSLLATEARSIKSSILSFMCVCFFTCFLIHSFSSSCVAIIIAIVYISISALLVTFMDKQIEPPIKISKIKYCTILLPILFVFTNTYINMPNIRLQAFVYYPEITVLFITLILFLLSGITALIKK